MSFTCVSMAVVSWSGTQPPDLLMSSTMYTGTAFLKLRTLL